MFTKTLTIALLATAVSAAKIEEKVPSHVKQFVPKMAQVQSKEERAAHKHSNQMAQT